jgi:hypothetical protein
MKGQLMDSREIVVVCVLSYYAGRAMSINQANRKIQKHNREVALRADVVKVAHRAMEECIDALIDPCSDKAAAIARYNETVKFANIIQQGVIR